MHSSVVYEHVHESVEELSQEFFEEQLWKEFEKILKKIFVNEAHDCSSLHDYLNCLGHIKILSMLYILQVSARQWRAIGLDLLTVHNQ